MKQMKNVKKRTHKKNKRTSMPFSSQVHLTDDERVDIFADIIVERVKELLAEEEELYQEKLKTDPNAKRFYEMKDWKKRWLKERFGNRKK